jgi:hypothetical protein
MTGGKPIAALLQSISGVSAINPLVTFYDIHGGKREVLFFYFVPDTTRDFYLLFTLITVIYYLFIVNEDNWCECENLLLLLSNLDS